MAKYKLSIEAREDLIRSYRYGTEKFGVIQADKYFDVFFEYFDTLERIYQKEAKNPEKRNRQSSPFNESVL